MIDEWPETYDYLLNFKQALLKRGSAAVRELAERTVFYTMYGVGTYTFAPCKVVWKRMASDLVAAVIATFPTPFGEKMAVPTDTTALIDFHDPTQAHYVCALLNSAPTRALVRSFSSAGRGFGAPSIIQHLGFPAYDPSNDLHNSLSSLSLQAHQLAAQGNEGKEQLRQAEEQIDHKAAELWGLTQEELKEIQASLKETS